MKITNTASSSDKKVLPKAGTDVARLFRIIDKGTVYSEMY